ncbi:MAG: tRNA uridine-5-carboxymethylaminomethyl(34) synthesis GTPase MnmE [Clostridia bacterium]|nr:tRNA uridine-5-carboxymethylaminomethyl(34) synthesis GTPase MnmE [Clostridia bacterium]
MTIAAIATANATGGIGIVRLSGEKSIEIANKIFSLDVTSFKSHTLHLGKIICNDKIIDEALVSVFKAPNSYTGEDVVEFNCHGGLRVCKMVLEAVYHNGANPAGPGEFTKRAFLNGKMDLSQAEAVADLISAETDDAVTVAANQLDKRLSNNINSLRDELVASTSHILAMIDFSEEGVEELDYTDLKSTLEKINSRISELILTSDSGRIIKDGINTAIIGTPNVGKSSILNTICGEDRAIVTNIEGTTRDVIETQVNIKGCKLNLLDTAGIRESDNQVEQIGVERSKDAIQKADLIFLVLDGSRELEERDQEVINLADKKKTICLINKNDLPEKLEFKDEFLKTVYVSAQTGEGFDELYDFIYNMYSVGDISEKIIITNPRHKQSLLNAKTLIDGILTAMECDTPFDIILGDIEVAISALGEIGGMTVSDEIIDSIFANFCVGK